MLPGYPFTADLHTVSTKNGQTTFESVTHIARASNGSIYQSQVFSEKESFNGRLKSVMIDDASSNCRITIHPFQSDMTLNQAGVMVGGASGLTFVLAISSAARSKNWTPSDVREMERRSQKLFTDHPISSDGDFHRTSLGERNANGMLLFGFRNEATADSGKDSVSEWWDSDLGFRSSSTYIKPSQGTTHSVNVTDLRLVEPDPSLFTIKDEYFPGTEGILNAKSLFMEGFSGHEAFERKVAEVLTTPGRVSLVKDRKEADLVASLELPTPPDGTKTSYNQIVLKIRDPKESDSLMGLFQISFNLHGSEEEWAVSPEINTCLSTLWTKIEMGRINSIPSQVP